MARKTLEMEQDQVGQRLKELTEEKIQDTGQQRVRDTQEVQRRDRDTRDEQTQHSLSALTG